MKRFNFKSVIGASIVASIVMTIFMWIFGMNIMKMLGMIAGYSGTMMYVIGGAIHLIVGIFWGFVYALFFEPWLKKLPGFLSGAFFSLVPFFAAMFFMGTFVTTVQGVFNANTPGIQQSGVYPSFPCQPACAPCNPYYPCQPSKPCHPCNPYGYSSATQQYGCAPEMGTCAPCAPMGSKAGLPMWLWSLFNHLVFGIVLGWSYKPKVSTE
ncbi:MAG: hypothetical protein SNF33_06325 [Candidatus Algichlamydia australiensis]|nr:hypothetical protein [Chlamydiales bacterium]